MWYMTKKNVCESVWPLFGTITDFWLSSHKSPYQGVFLALHRIPSNAHVILCWCTDLVWGSSSPCLRPQAVGFFWMFVPGHVSSSSILSWTNHAVIFQNILSRTVIQENWCNMVSLLVWYFFNQELLFKISVLLEMLPVKFPVATQESLTLKAEISCKAEGMFCCKGLSSSTLHC